MAGQSLFTLEERIVTSTWVHERHNTGDTLDIISAKFKEKFKKNPPTRKAMSKWESKLFETGDIKRMFRKTSKALSKTRVGRPVKR